MKKVIVLIIMLATAVCSFAQVGWRTEVHHADELKGTEEYTAYIYTDSKGDYIVLWSNTDEDFRIVSNRHIFNYNSGGTKWFSSTVGLYDENGKLIEKVGIDFGECRRAGEVHPRCQVARYVQGDCCPA